MTREIFLSLMQQRGLDLLAAEMAWSRWADELGTVSVADFDRALGSAAIAQAVIDYLEDRVN